MVQNMGSVQEIIQIVQDPNRKDDKIVIVYQEGVCVVNMQNLN